MKTAREIVLHLLGTMEKNNSYSNIVLEDALLTKDLSLKDKSFVSVLFYGKLERKIALDYIISQYSKTKLNKLDISILNILRMGIYQINYLNTVYDFAAVNESVNLVNKIKKPHLKGFVNAILRNFLRSNRKVKMPDKSSDIINYISIEYSCPKYIIDIWIKMYGKDKCIDILKSSIGKSPIFIKVNNLKISEDNFIKNLINLNSNLISSTTYLPYILKMDNIDNIRYNKLYLEGLFHVQDLSSVLCCNIIDPKEGETIFDICSGLGGKSFTIAQRINNIGIIKSFDIFEHKLKLIKDGANRLGITIIDTHLNDATKYNKKIGLADKVLCDVPCSGLGIIRRKSEIKYKLFEQIKNLPNIQYDILLKSSKYVKNGGYLIYSTCTLNRYENDMVIDKFLENNLWVY